MIKLTIGRRYFRLLTLALLPICLLLPPALAHQSASGPIDVSGADGTMMPAGENDPHMRMTALRSPTAEDQAKADEIAQALKDAITPYADISLAEADGYRPFPPDPSDLRIVHYVNIGRSWQESRRLDPQKPGSLLYERQPDGSLSLIGAMFTAPDDASEAELNQRVPLSMAQWHLHTNICVPRPIWDAEQWTIERDGRPQFGPESAIATAADCDAVGGDFWPTAFGWMVHAYVFADDPADIWNPMH
ncbi:MAG: hypothetical protein WBB01_15205 [Phormidesmis sp.]